MSNIKFRGAGINGSGWMTAINAGNFSPSRETLPAGATWPFASLDVGDKRVSFDILHIHREARPSNSIVHLSRYGYVFFYCDGGQDFGFATVKVKKLINELDKRGFKLDESCRRNLLFANFLLAFVLLLSVAVVVFVTTMAIIKPNGF